MGRHCTETFYGVWRYSPTKRHLKYPRYVGGITVRHCSHTDSAVGCLFLFLLFFICDANFNHYLDKCGVLNEITESAIFIFKINTNIISNTRVYRISKLII